MDRDLGTSRRVGFPLNDVGHVREEFRRLRRRLRLDEQLSQVRRAWRPENNRGVRIVSPRNHLLLLLLDPRLGLGFRLPRQARDLRHDVSRRAVPGDLDLWQQESRRRRRHTTDRENRKQQKRVADQRSRQLPAAAARRGHPQPEEGLGRAQSPNLARSPNNHAEVAKKIRRGPLPAHSETGWLKRTESAAGAGRHGEKTIIAPSAGAHPRTALRFRAYGWGWGHRRAYDRRFGKRFGLLAAQSNTRVSRSTFTGHRPCQAHHGHSGL